MEAHAMRDADHDFDGNEDMNGIGGRWSNLEIKCLHMLSKSMVSGLQSLTVDQNGLRVPQAFMPFYHR